MATVQIRDIVAGDYCNHVGSTHDDLGHIFIAATMKVGDDIHCLIRRRRLSTGVWTDVHLFDQDTYGKHGYCTLEAVGRHLYCYLSERQPDGSTQIREYVIPDVCNVL